MLLPSFSFPLPLFPCLISPPELSDLLPINVYLFQSNDSTQAQPPPLLLPWLTTSQTLCSCYGVCLLSPALPARSWLPQCCSSLCRQKKVCFISSVGKVNSAHSNSQSCCASGVWSVEVDVKVCVFQLYKLFLRDLQLDNTEISWQNKR